MIWLEYAVLWSAFALVQLLVLALSLNARAVDGAILQETQWSAVLAPTVVLLALYTIWIIVRNVYALALLCCNTASGRRRTTISVNDNDDYDDDDVSLTTATKQTLSGTSTSSAAADRLAQYATQSNAESGSGASLTRAERRSEGWTRFGDNLIDMVFLALLWLAVVGLVHYLNARDIVQTNSPPLPSVVLQFPSAVPFFGVVFAIQGFLALIILIANVNSFALERTKFAGNTGGFLGFSLTDREHREANNAKWEEREAELDRNANTEVARRARYQTRAEFQDWDCVHMLTPRTLVNFIVYLRAALLIALLVATILSTISLFRRTCALDELFVRNLATPSDVTPQQSLAMAHVEPLMAPTPLLDGAQMRQFHGRHHHVATHALAHFIASGNFSANHKSLQWHDEDGIVPLSVVLLPLFVVLGLLLLQTPCMAITYLVANSGRSVREKARTMADWLIGAIFVVFLIALILSMALLADRIDSSNFQADWNATFAALYIAFGLCFLIGAPTLACCLPKRHNRRLIRRAIVSRWGVFIHRRN